MLIYTCKACGLKEDHDRVPEKAQKVHPVAYLDLTNYQGCYPAVCIDCWKSTLDDWDNRMEMYNRLSETDGFCKPRLIEGRHGWYYE